MTRQEIILKIVCELLHTKHYYEEPKELVDLASSIYDEILKNDK